MSTVNVFHPKKTDKKLVKVERNLCWYDTLKKEMVHFIGGSLKYSYVLDNSLEIPQYRMIPSVDDLYIADYNNSVDKNAVYEWFNKYDNYNVTQASIVDRNESQVVFEVPDEEVSDFAYDLDRNRIAFEVD